MDTQLLKTYALSFLGKPYFYGGDDPISGFDCSGLVSELMRAAGLVPWNWRSNAQGIYDALNGNGMRGNPTCLGALVFFGPSEKSINHVGFCVDSHTMVEAGGGDSNTTTGAKASQTNAFVRLRPIRFRRDLVAVIVPEYPALF